jgi:hypothetical protein
LEIFQDFLVLLHDRQMSKKFGCFLQPVMIIGGLYYKHITIVNDDSRLYNDAPSCGITYDHHSDETRGVIYTAREHLQYSRQSDHRFLFITYNIILFK